MTTTAPSSSTTEALEPIRTPSERRNTRRALILSYVVLLFFSILYIGPLLMLINTAFKTLPEFYQDPIGLAQSFNFDNFTEAWELANFPRYMINSIIYAAVATTIFVITSVFVAFPIARGYVKGAGALLTLYVVALFLPPALIPQFQLILNLGLYNTRQGYVLLFLVNAIGMIVLVNYIKSIPRELDESASMDGCSYPRFVFSILMPLIKPAIATVTVLHAIGIWNEIILPTIYFSNSDYYPITRGLVVFEGVYGSNWPGLAAAVLMLALPMVILFLILQRYIISGLTGGAVKG